MAGVAVVFTMAGGDSEQLIIYFCIGLFESFEATMAFLLACCTAFSKSVEWHRGNDSELHVAVIIVKHD